MRIALDSLPTDTTMLQQLVRDMAAALDEGQVEIDRLRLIIKQFQHACFRRSPERLDPDQMAFGLEELEAELARAEARRAAAMPPASADAVPVPPTKPLHQRRYQPPAAHRGRHTAPHETCPDRGGVLQTLGPPAARCWTGSRSRSTWSESPGPSGPAAAAAPCIRHQHRSGCWLAGGLATPGLIAYVLVSRYCDHLPLYRQSRIFAARHGLEISRSTLSGWIGAACWWLEALHARLVAHVVAVDRVFADDTPLPVLEPGRGRTKTGRLWAYTRDDRSYGGNVPPAVVFHYAADRTATRPAEHLKTFRGILQVDGYAGFEALADTGTVTLAACWAHARRKFFELHEAGSPVATEAVQRIGEIYKIEATIRGKPPDERLRVRKQHSVPVVEVLQAWLDLQLSRLPGRSRLAEAIRYALGRGSAPTRFLDDGRIDLDTNPVERAIRPIALGRKNSLFAGSEDGANRWAIVASLVETAKLNGVEPFAWMRDNLTLMIDGSPGEPSRRSAAVGELQLILVDGEHLTPLAFKRSRGRTT